ncbi:MAG: protein jag [Candidatus Ruminococcus intestinipullorum]|nr:protein jag [Candidatus Ruminococcus intestinipullorum]
MNGSIRVSAKTVDDAITEALIQLGVTSDRLEYKVIEKGSLGFLGIGMKQAVIEAWKKEEPVEEIEEPKSVSVETKEEKELTEVSKVGQDKVSEDTIQAVESFLKDTLKAMGMDVEITSEIDEEGALNIDMKGDNMGILIGKRGQTLDSLQYLANRVANKYQDSYVRVKLDTENYRARREETLRKLAKNIASKVKRTRRAVSLEPMNPYERRIIHAALQSDPQITTHSEGEEPYRKVVIALKR